jgi:hypothetical protein
VIKEIQINGSSVLRQFLIAAIFFAFCAFVPTILNALIQKKSISSLVIGDEATMHSFRLAMYLRDFIYRWLLMMALVPAVAASRSITAFLILVFGIHIFNSILAGFTYGRLSVALAILIPQSVIAFLFIPLNAVFVWLFVRWQKSVFDNELVYFDQSSKYSQLLWKCIVAVSIPIICLAIPIALFVAFALLSGAPWLLFLLMPIASSFVYFWRVLFVAAIGLSIANFCGAKNWSKYFAIASATVPAISEIPNAFFWSGGGFCPECRVFFYSFALVSLMVWLWYLGLRNRFMTKLV